MQVDWRARVSEGGGDSKFITRTAWQAGEGNGRRIAAWQGPQPLTLSACNRARASETSDGREDDEYADPVELPPAGAPPAAPPPPPASFRGTGLGTGACRPCEPACPLALATPGGSSGGSRRPDAVRWSEGLAGTRSPLAAVAVVVGGAVGGTRRRTTASVVALAVGAVAGVERRLPVVVGPAAVVVGPVLVAAVVVSPSPPPPILATAAMTSSTSPGVAPAPCNCVRRCRMTSWSCRCSARSEARGAYKEYISWAIG